MRMYIISVAGAAIISSVVNMLSPEKWTKYISVITGLVVAIAIGRPVFNLINADVFSEIRFETENLSDSGMTQFYDELRRELEERLCGDIKTRLKNEFGADCEVSAEVSSDSEGRVLGVSRITIYGGHLDYAASARLREIYGAEEVILNGDRYRRKALP